jgi:hypothetical protein
LIEAPDTKKVNPPGEWNSGRIVSKDRNMEHWLNGKLMVIYTLGNEEFKALVQKSKFKDTKGYGEKASGQIRSARCYAEISSDFQYFWYWKSDIKN